MKKIMTTFVWLSTTGATLQAQTFNEWFRQNKTQLKYLREQIATLASLWEVTDEGYRWVQQGLGLVASLEQADSTLHATHFAALDAINPALRNDSTLALIARLADCSNWLAGQLRLMAGTIKPHADFLISTADGLQQHTIISLETTNELLTEDFFSMQDADRWTALRAILNRMALYFQLALDIHYTCLLIEKDL